MKPKIENIKYACRWAKNKETSWSGTSYSLQKALMKYVEVEDIDMTLSKIEKVIIKLLNISIKDGKIVTNKPAFCSKAMTYFLEKKYKKRLSVCKASDRVLQIGCFGYTDVPFYTYQDLSVTALVDMVEKKDPAFQYSTYQDISLDDLKRRALEQVAVYQKAEGVFTMGKWLADFFINEIGLPSSKVHAVGGGTNIDPTKVDFSKKRGNKLLFVGRDFTRKGGDLVCRAFDYLQRNLYPQAELFVAGPEQMPEECKLNEKIHYLGALKYTELVEYFNKCDVFCMPSRYEAYGLVFVEALIYGLPCIAMNKYEMKYFVEHGKNGYLIDDENIEILSQKMYDALKNTDMKEFVKRNHDYYVSAYSWESVAERVLNIMNTDAMRIGE